MEPPPKAGPEAIRNEKVKVLQSMFPLDLHEYVRGQYIEGRVGGDVVVGYHSEENVSEDSGTETFVALALHVDNWRWKDVPFYIRAGKRMTHRVTQISVVFKEPPVCLFEGSGSRVMHPNVFDIRLQPSEGFELAFEMKVPGEGYNLQTQRLHFHYDEEFGALPPAYVTLLADVMTGDQTLFVRADEVEEAWRIIAPALTDRVQPPDPYPAGSWGPPSANELLARTGRSWQALDTMD
jgi:glucose-6-phosphate 1-dehydrogenase